MRPPLRHRPGSVGSALAALLLLLGSLIAAAHHHPGGTAPDAPCAACALQASAAEPAVAGVVLAAPLPRRTPVAPRPAPPLRSRAPRAPITRGPPALG